MDKKIVKKEIVDFLVSNDKVEERIVVLFPSTIAKNNFSTLIDNALDEFPSIRFNKAQKFKITQNEVIVDNKKVVLGLTTHESYLSDSYTKEEIKYYAKDEKGN
jgi:hypothetical protein